MKRTQGIIYLGGGLWPALHMRSFERLTGRKEDRWLVRTVGLLTAGIGLVLLKAEDSKDTKRLGALSAVSFGVIDFYYTAKGRIKKIYATDGIIQAALLAGWLRHKLKSDIKD